MYETTGSTKHQRILFQAIIDICIKMLVVPVRYEL